MQVTVDFISPDFDKLKCNKTCIKQIIYLYTQFKLESAEQFTDEHRKVFNQKLKLNKDRKYIITSNNKIPKGISKVQND